MKPTHPGPESVVLALLVARDVVVRVASVPAELVLFVRGHIHVLEVSVGLLPVAGGVVAAIALLGKLVALGGGVGRAKRHANRKYRLQKNRCQFISFAVFLLPHGFVLPCAN